MTAFWTAAVGLTALAWLMLAMPGRPPSSGHGQRRGASNLLVLKDQLTSLTAEFSAGHIDATEHAEARAEIERRVLEDADADASARGTGKPAALTRNAALALAAGIPVIAFGLYGFLGNPDGLTLAAAPQPAAAEAAASEEVSPQAVAAMLDDMAKRMDTQPAGSTDAAGWALLARSNAALQRFGEASRAYARAIALAPNDAQLLADQADVLSMLQDRSTRGEPGRLIARALQLDPNNLKALALAGSDAFERKDFAVALDHWSKARKLAPAGNFADSLDRSVQEARTSLGTASSTASNNDAAPSPTVASGGQVGGRISLAPELASRVLPTDTVFVFARAETGPRMPLAIARYKASDLPVDFKLSDANAMSDALRLSNFTRVVIGARVSRSGDATPGAGDLQGQSEAVSTRRSDVAVTIDSVRP